LRGRSGSSRRFSLISQIIGLRKPVLVRGPVFFVCCRLNEVASYISCGNFHILCIFIRNIISLGTYENHKKAIDRLHEEALYPFVSLPQLHERIKTICEEFDNEWRSQNIFEINPWTFSKPHIIFSVNERIRLSNIIMPNESNNFEEKYHIPPLSEYLLLTCIDQLGQSIEWMPFENWLNSKKKKSERDTIVSTISKTYSNEQFTLELYKGYQKIYGVKNSFFNCFYNLIANVEKQSFLSQLKIEVYNNYPKNPFYTLGNEKDKIKYLFSVRNNYTHRIKPSGPYILLWPEHTDAEGWFEKETIYGKPVTQKIKVTENYLKELEKFVKLGIWNFILSK
jgi:hypothetical protein